MGKIWGPDAVAKNQSTSFYGNIVSLAESPKQENLLYVGTDDGLIEVSADGLHWAPLSRAPGIVAQQNKVITLYRFAGKYHPFDRRQIDEPA